MPDAARQVQTPEDYLAGEKDSSIRHEYVLGEVYAMAGASDGHVTVSGNMLSLLKTHLRGSDCRVYMTDMKVRYKRGDAFFYPDLLVTCDPADRKKNYFKDAPRLLIEVISPTTEGFDRGGKFAYYRQIESLAEYVLIDPREYRVDVFNRNEAGRWELTGFVGADSIVELRSIGLGISMRDIFEDVDFELAREPEEGAHSPGN